MTTADDGYVIKDEIQYIGANELKVQVQSLRYSPEDNDV